MNKKVLTLAMMAVTATLGLTACGNDELSLNTNIQGYLLGKPATTAGVVSLYGVNLDQDGSVALTTRTLSGLNLNEAILDMDYRTADGKLYALTTASRIVGINTSTGALTAISTLKDSGGALYPLVLNNGSVNYSIDFDPLADNLRVISNDGRNLQVDIASGLVTVQTPVNPTSNVISSIAYTDIPASGSTAASTQLYTIDVNSDQLLMQTPVSSGTQTAGKPLGVNATAVLGYDIVSNTNTGYALLTVGGATSLYRINQNASGGVATRVSGLPNGVNYASLAAINP